MENWRKKGDKCNQELARTKSNNHNGKQPFGGNSNWQPSVPLWEKRFVSSVGSFSWKKFLEARKFTHLYSNVLQWDDSAGEEAFRASKEKFYANFHGLPCDIKTHNPDLYIDQIDWNAETDQTLILEFDSDSLETPDADSNHDPVVIFGDSFPDPYKDYSHGWGELDEKVKKGNKDGINWNEYINNRDIDFGGSYNLWDSNENDKKAEKDQDWSDNDHKNVYWGWNDDYSNYYGNGNNERHKMTRFHGDNNNNYSHRNRSWRNNNANRRKPNAQSQRNHVSNIQTHGSQWIHVHP